MRAPVREFAKQTHEQPSDDGPRFVAEFGRLEQRGVTWDEAATPLHGVATLSEAGAVAASLISSSGTASWRWPSPDVLVGRIGRQVVRIRAVRDA